MTVKLPCIIIAALVLAGIHAQADPEIAIAMRYLQAEGESHAQLYLFREDGKLLRQLTHEKTGQVMEPVFAPDGESIVFKIVKGQATEFWSVTPRGGGLHRLGTAPDWYGAAKEAPYFTNAQPIPAGVEIVLKAKVDDSQGTFTTPDRKQELVLQSPADDPHGHEDFEGHGSHYLLRDLKTKKSVELGSLDGFYGLYELLYRNGKIGDVFLVDPPLRLAFFAIHLDSTDGDTVFALDLNMPRLVRLSTNWSMPVPLPGEAAFLTFTEALYQPIPGSTKSANGSYIARWDSDLKHVRYGRDDTACVCYGASMYRPGKQPATIVVEDLAGPYP